ncbi:Guanylate kinase [Butyrivibrio sp. INlla18]|jgi:guanylate kinase|uniref:guanylate kinase n=1 Tax=unclassified Butyrivibrio TaxID=2639466 RepID=UPI000887C1F4|nr:MULTISPECIES: guanylate kinase [unclassified Butyrivibrio]MBE5840679.1 guanylate kinase [Butyrivibrio sp.]SDA56575.1 Guanylate kinase [Butyrivibrio sp. INlla18]
MGRIFLLMGKSTSGKDTIYRELIKNEELKLNKVIPYTTRPMRDGETDGVQYFFKDEQGYQNLKADGKIIEERTYHTNYGEWRYFTVDDGQIDLSAGNYLVIGTLESYCYIRDYFGKENVVPLLIDVDAKIRLQRAMHREDKQEHPKYDEMCRRFLADEEDFSEDKIAQAMVQDRFKNNDKIDDCINEITRYIIQKIG